MRCRYEIWPGVLTTVIGVYADIRKAVGVPPSARWDLVVSRNTDDALRQLLASQGRARKGELSRLVEEAVRARTFELTAEDAKRRNVDLSADEVAGIVDEALEWARRG